MSWLARNRVSIRQMVREARQTCYIENCLRGISLPPGAEQDLAPAHDDVGQRDERVGSRFVRA